MTCALGAATGCTLPTEVGIDHPDVEVVAVVPPQLRHELDLLFVVDTTAGAGALQADAARLWQRVRDHLAFVEGGLSVRIGVVSSDVGDGGAGVPGCTPAGDEGALRRDAGGARWLELDQGLLAMADDAVAARLALGEGGCAYAQPLHALARALRRGAPDADFVRPDAALGIVAVSGADDCSFAGAGFVDAVPGSGPLDTFRCFREGVRCAGDDVHRPDDAIPPGDRMDCGPRDESAYMAPVAWSAAWLGALKGDPTAVAAGGLIGDPDRVSVIVVDDGPPALGTTCEKSDRPVYPGVRLGALVAALGGATASACGAPSRGAAAPIAHDLRRALGHRCLEGPILDVSPEQGMQVVCEVHAIDAGGDRRRLRACANPALPFGEAGPCYAIRERRELCDDFPSALGVEVNWGGARPELTPPGTWTEVACLTAPDAPDVVVE